VRAVTRPVNYRQIAMRCCGYSLQWINFSSPSYCPACGTYVPDAERWVSVRSEAELALLSKGLKA